MAYNVTRLDLRTRARQASLQENSGFCTDAEVNAMINAAIASLYDIECESSPPDYYSTDFAISTVAGQVAYALPTDFRSLQDVYVVDPTRSDRMRALLPAMPSARGRYQAPQSVVSVLLRYTPAPPLLTADSGAGGTFDFVSGWDEYVVQYVARDMLMKEGSDTSQQQLKLQELQRRIESAAKSRSQGFPSFINEIEDTDQYGTYWAQSIARYTLRAGFLDLLADSPVWWPQ